MITSLRLVNFKNFADETLRVGPFTVIVGANASGKSNIRDAFRFLHGIGRGYTLAEAIGGKHGAGGQVEWEPIRGAMNEFFRILESTEDTSPSLPAFGLEVGLTADNTDVTYTVEVSREIFRSSGFRITYERLLAGGEEVYEKPRSLYGERRVSLGDDGGVDIMLDKPALTQVRDSEEVWQGRRERIEPIVEALANMRFLDLVPDRMREPVFPGQTVLGDSGENLPAVLREICTDPKRREILTAWARELTPMDMAGFDFPEDPSGRIHLKLIERSGREVSAYSASDGTLRFLALLAALFGEEPARLYFFKEIDNGIHPARLHLLIDLIERQTAKARVQVVSTTHSPDLISMVNDDTFGNMSVVCRLEDSEEVIFRSEDAIIRPVSDLPNARELRKTQGLGRLLAGGWMETALRPLPKVTGTVRWIPVFTGMSARTPAIDASGARSHARGEHRWIPAFAGMTAMAFGLAPCGSVIPARVGTHTA